MIYIDTIEEADAGMWGYALQCRGSACIDENCCPIQDRTGEKWVWLFIFARRKRLARILAQAGTVLNLQEL